VPLEPTLSEVRPCRDTESLLLLSAQALVGQQVLPRALRLMIGARGKAGSFEGLDVLPQHVAL
jgi:hypothetical protein